MEILLGGSFQSLMIVLLVLLKKFGNEGILYTRLVIKQLPKQLPFYDLVGFSGENLIKVNRLY